MALSSSQKLTALLTKITSKHNGNFYCFNCLLLFTKEHKLESQKKLCENKKNCDFVIVSQGTKILEFN